MPKALITGASGFIGRHLVPHLIEKGYDLRCLVRPASDRSFLGQFPVEFAFGDVTDFESVRRAVDSVEFVFHLAGVAQVVSNRQFFELHTQGTINVAEACLQVSRPPRLIHVSSLAAMGPARDKKPTTETAFPRPVSPYGRSKHLAEKALCGRADQLPCSIVRPPYVIGEGDRASEPLFRMIYKQHIHLIPGFFNNLYSFVHAEDLAHLLALVAEKGELLAKNSLPSWDRRHLACARQAGSLRSQDDEGRGIYNASCGEFIKFGDFGRMIAKACGIEKIRIIKTPPMVCAGVGLFYEVVKKLTGKTVPLDWNKVCEALRGPWICDDEKARTQLSFVPQPFEKRIEQTVGWYRF